MKLLTSKTKKRVLSLILAVITVFSVFPLTTITATAGKYPATGVTSVKDAAAGVFGAEYTERITELAYFFGLTPIDAENYVVAWLDNNENAGKEFKNFADGAETVDDVRKAAVLEVLFIEHFLTNVYDTEYEYFLKQAQTKNPDASEDEIKDIVEANVNNYKLEEYKCVLNSDVIFRRISSYRKAIETETDVDEIIKTFGTATLEIHDELGKAIDADTIKFNVDPFRKSLSEARANPEPITSTGNFDTLVNYYTYDEPALKMLGYDYDQIKKAVYDVISAFKEGDAGKGMTAMIQDFTDVIGDNDATDEEKRVATRNAVVSLYIFLDVLCGTPLLNSENAATFVCDNASESGSLDQLYARIVALNSDTNFKDKAKLVEALQTGNVMTFITTVMSVYPRTVSEFEKIFKAESDGVESLYYALYSYDIVNDADESHGTISVTTDAFPGQKVTVTATPDAGYVLGGFKVYKTGDTDTVVNTVGTHFVMPDYSVTIEADFKKSTQLEKIAVYSKGALSSDTWYKYDENGNKISSEQHRYKGGVCTPNQRYKYTYNEDGTLASEAYYSYNSSSKTFELKTVKEYTYKNGELASSETFKPSGGDLVKSAITEYEEYVDYNDGGHIVQTQTSSNWDSEEEKYIPSQIIKTLCNSRGEGTLKTTFKYTSDGGTWVETASSVYTYDIDGNLTTTSSCGKPGIKVSFYEYKYDDYGYCVCDISKREWNSETSSWGVTTEMPYQYENGLKISYQFMSTSRTLFTYDSDGRETSKISQNLSGGEFVTSGSTEYYYRYNIATASATNGTVSVSETALRGDEVTVTTTPAGGYKVDSITVCKTGDTGTTVEVTGNTFVMPDFDVTVTVVFGKTDETLFAEFKDEQKKALDSLGEDCDNVIANAKQAIDNTAYDGNKSLDDNKAEIYGIVSTVENDLIAAKANAFNQYKQDKKEALDALMPDCDNVIADAKTAIDNLSYDGGTTLADNKTAIDNIVSPVAADLAKAKGDAFALYKEEQKLALDSLGEDCDNVIADAKQAIDNLTYDNELGLDGCKALVDDIVSPVATDLNTAKTDAFNQYKQDQKDALDALMPDCDNIIANAKNAIDNLTYDSEKTLADNKTAIDNIVSPATTDLATAKEEYRKSHEPTITDGANAAIEMNGTETVATFRSEAPFDEFVRVEVDGTVVSPENYDVSQGSTVVVLHNDYLNTLGNGTHSLSVVSTNGHADTQFTITGISPATGDTLLSVSIASIALISLAGYGLCKKRKTR